MWTAFVWLNTETRGELLKICAEMHLDLHVVSVIFVRFWIKFGQCRKLPGQVHHGAKSFLRS